MHVVYLANGAVGVFARHTEAIKYGVGVYGKYYEVR